MKLITVSSGSKSNAWIVECDSTLLLIDCGVSCRTLTSVFKEHGLSLDDLRAVFITHSHSDHTKGLTAVCKRLRCPVYSAVEVEGCEKINDSVMLNNVKISFFPCSHDVPCVGYRIECGDTRLCFATDSGVVTEPMRRALYGCQTVVLESNHDIDMLKSGPYPPALKMRIASSEGHLSNKDCAECILSIADGGLKRAVLAHLSETNNYPLMARATAEAALKKYGITGIEILTASDGLEIELE